MKRLSNAVQAPVEAWKSIYRRRLASYLAEMLGDVRSVLDVGCGDGATAEAVRVHLPNARFVGVDVAVDRRVRIPAARYDGRRLPFADGSFDAVMAVDVLHHTTDIGAVLAEMARVAARVVVLKDHAVTGRWTWMAVAGADWVTNAPYGVPCPFNYPTVAEWRDYFAGARLCEVRFRDDLELGPLAGRATNPMFGLVKG